MPRLPFLPVPALLAVASLLGVRLSHVPDDSVPKTKHAAAAPDLAQHARITIGLYCSSCHNQGRAKIDLDDSVVATRDRSMWVKVANALRAETMPPPGGKWPVPSAEERQTLITWIEQEFLKEAPESERLRSRRLLRHEYLNTIRDLVGVSFQPAADFPEDDPSWKRSADLPAVSPLVLEKYQAAAEQILLEFLLARAPIALAPPGPDDVDGGDSVESCEVENSMLSSKQEEAREFIADFAYRAYRRPLLKKELKELVATYRRAIEQGEGYEDSLKAALKAVLTAPQFLFRTETIAAAGDPVPSSRERQFELASRLSYFLWSSIPDAELLALADRELLVQELGAQTKRMLQSPKSSALGIDFANSWLELGKLPVQGNELFGAARQETQQFVAAIVNEDRSVLELLDADYTFLNERLARHYGIEGIHGGQMRRVTLPDNKRGGLISQAGVLMLMSPEASLVRRGKWVLENLLGSAPLAPPSGLLQAFRESRTSFERGTVQQLMEKHRSNPSCAACHTKMDALGISLENFAADGAWRTKVYGLPVEAVGILPGGETIDGPVQLRAHLLKNRDLFVRGLSCKLLSYALGRKLDAADLDLLDSIPSTVSQNQHRFSSVVQAVVQSELFQNLPSQD